MDHVSLQDARAARDAESHGNISIGAVPKGAAPHGDVANAAVPHGSVPQTHGATAEGTFGQEDSPRSLAKCVHRAILRLAPGKIRGLRVEVRQGTISLFGSCSSFYCKQIAQHAAMDLAHGEQVNNQIAVDG